MINYTSFVLTGTGWSTTTPFTWERTESREADNPARAGTGSGEHSAIKAAHWSW